MTVIHNKLRLHSPFNWLFLVSTLAFLASVSVQAQPVANNGIAKTIEIPLLSGAIDINGQLDESLWNQAALIEDLHQVFPEEYVNPTEPTQVRVFYTEDALYIGANLLESDPANITDRVLRQGQSLDSDDVFAVIIDPYLDQRNGYRFEVNPNGVRWEGLFQNIIEVEGNWDGIWEARAQRNNEGWSAEIRIPFQSLSFNPDSSTWGINFNRIRRISNESIAWMSYNREVNPSTAGTATGLEGLRQGVGLDVVPSMTLRRNRKFGLGGFEENHYEPQLDVFYKVTPQLNASLTLNTDFSATEMENAELVHALDQEGRMELAQIQHALERLESGDYFECAACGEPIGEKRLEAIPFTDKCINCAE